MKRTYAIAGVLFGASAIISSITIASCIEKIDGGTFNVIDSTFLIVAFALGVSSVVGAFKCYIRM